MNLLRSPRSKLIAALGCVLVLALVAPRVQSGPSTGSLALGGLLLAALVGAWLMKKKGSAQLPEQGLQVLARAGLNPRCGMALVEAAGERLLVIHGDGFAQIRPMPTLGRRQGRRSPPAPRLPRAPQAAPSRAIRRPRSAGGAR
jgi:flagellar protein FliO/FliZ